MVLAGSDHANGWAGFIDGAIESGTCASGQVHALLTSADALGLVDETALVRS